MYKIAFKYLYISIFSDNYEIARKKLKQAEDFSDINSGTEIDETLKKSRKHRAAKKLISDTDESSTDDDMILSQIPKIPNKDSTTVKKTLNNIKDQNVHQGNHDNIIIFKSIIATK